MTNVGTTPSQLNINVGSGRYPMKGFVNLDNSIFLRTLPIYPVLKPFLRSGHREIFEEYRTAVADNTYRVHNCIKTLPYGTGSVDHILSSHFLEHVFSGSGPSDPAGFSSRPQARHRHDASHRS